MGLAQRKTVAPKRETHPRPAMDRRPTSHLPPGALAAALTLAVCATVLAVYAPVLSAGALFIDDHQYLVENPLVQSPGRASAGRFFREVLEPSTVGGYYQPLAMISLMADYAIGGRPDRLWVFHATSLALHVANTALVVAFLYLLFGRPWPAALVGLLFGAHPLHIESIAWVAERKTVLAAFFAMLHLILYVAYTRRPAWTRYAACLATYVLALLSKPTTTPLPLLLLLLDFWPLRRLSKRTILEKLPFFIIGIVSAVITCISQSRTGGAGLPGEFPAMRIPLILCHNTVFYLAKILWPAHLSPFYAFPEPLGPAHRSIRLGLIGTCLLIPALLLSLRWTRALLTGWLFFFIAILPTMGIIGFTVVIAADRFTYLPMVGLLLPITWFLLRPWDGAAGGRSRRLSRVAAVAVVLSAVVAEAAATRAYLGRWRDTEALYRYALRTAPNAPWLHANLAATLNEKGAFDEGIQHCEAALRVLRDDPEAHNNLGGALQEKNKIDEAVVHYREAVRLRPNYALAHHNLATALHALGRTDEAIMEWNEALRLRPLFPDAHNNLGSALLEQGKLDEAIGHYRSTLAIQPDHVEARYNLGAALARQGKLTDAINTYADLLRRHADHAPSHYALAHLLVRQGRAADAIREYGQVLRIDPTNTGARNELNALLKKTPATSQPSRGAGLHSPAPP